MNEKEVQTNSVFPEYMFKDPVLTFFSLPIIPFILLTQSINNIIMAGMPKNNILTTQAATGYYKNDEEWQLYEEAGKLVIKVHRNAQRK